MKANTANELKNRAQRCLLQLRKNGLTPKDIEQKINGQVSWRTLYRWMNGEKTPQRPFDVIALENLLKKEHKK